MTNQQAPAASVAPMLTTEERMKATKPAVITEDVDLGLVMSAMRLMRSGRHRKMDTVIAALLAEFPSANIVNVRRALARIGQTMFGDELRAEEEAEAAAA